MQSLNSSAVLALLPATSASAAVGSAPAGTDAASITSMPDEQADGAGFSALLDALMPAAEVTKVAAAPVALPLVNRLLPLQNPLADLPDDTALLPGSAVPGIESADAGHPVTALLKQIGFGTVMFRQAADGSDEALPDTSPEDEAALMADVPAGVPSGMSALPLTPVVAMPAAETEADIPAQGRMNPASAGAAPEAVALTEDEGQTAMELINTDAPEALITEDADLSAPARTPAQNAPALQAALTSGQPTAVAADAPVTTTTAATVAAAKAASADIPQQLTQTLHAQSIEFGADRREWGGALGARIVTMVANDIQQARIQLDPPELGSLEIRLQVQQDQATVQVQTQNAQVREVLESSAQRLRDALAGQGIQLSGFDVSERGQQQGGQGDQPADQQSADGEWVALEDDTPVQPRPVNSLNLLDTFA